MAAKSMNSMSSLMNGDGSQFGGGQKPGVAGEFKVMEATQGKVPAIPSIGKDSKSGAYSGKDQK